MLLLSVSGSDYIIFGNVDISYFHLLEYLLFPLLKSTNHISCKYLHKRSGLSFNTENNLQQYERWSQASSIYRKNICLYLTENGEIIILFFTLHICFKMVSSFFTSIYAEGKGCKITVIIALRISHGIVVIAGNSVHTYFNSRTLLW